MNIIAHPEFEYLVQIANKVFPEYEYKDSAFGKSHKDITEDDYYQVESIMSSDFINSMNNINFDVPYTYDTFDNEDFRESIKKYPADTMNSSKIVPFPFSYEDYIDNIEIIETLEGYNINVDKFWYAILFIYYATMCKTKHCSVVDRSNIEDATIFKNKIELSKEKGIKINGSTIAIKNKHVLDSVSNFLSNYIEDVGEFSSVQPFVQNQKEEDKEKICVPIWYASKCLDQLLFDCLKLPHGNKARNNYKKKLKEDGDSKTDCSLFEPKKGLLVSRIIYFFGLTDNEDYILTGLQLSSLMTKYEKYELRTMSNSHFV